MSTNEKRIKSRSIQKHDLEVNWLKATTFIPFKGEFIIYDIEVDEHGNVLTLPTGRTNPYDYERIKIGDGITSVTDLPFITDYMMLLSSQVKHGDYLLSNIINQYLIDIDYNLLAFDTSEIVINNTTNKTSILGQAILGQMILS